MKPFRFSLQSIRVLREHKERDAQQLFSAAMRACEEAAFALQESSEALAGAWTSLCQDLSSGVAATNLVQTRAWCDVLETRQKERNAALHNARRAMNHAWREMIHATRERETLDQYHAKCRRAYDREAQRQEQKRLDELGLRRPVIAGLFSTAPTLRKDRP